MIVDVGFPQTIMKLLQSGPDAYSDLDGMRLVEDITYSDSFGHEIIALNNGSYILIEDGREIICGEAYRILDGTLEQICADNQQIVL